MSFRRILAAIDHSPLGDSVFQRSLDLAKTDAAKLLLFHSLMVDTVPTPPPFAGELGLAPQIINQAYEAQQLYMQQHTREMRVLLQQYCEIALRQGVGVEFEYSTTDAGPGICQTAQKWGADLIVMGRRGRRGLTEVLLGSVSNYVLHHSPCAVLVLQAERLNSVSSGTGDRQSQPLNVSQI
jgi:nucleotide-binding universal stress UspA family protein